MSSPIYTWQEIALTTRSIDKADDPNIRGDAFKTLFIARLSYDTTEKDLEREFGRFGPIERVCHVCYLTLWCHTLIFSSVQIRVVTDSSEDAKMENGTAPKKKEKTHRGYAFVVYEREKDMKGILPLLSSL